MADGMELAHEARVFGSYLTGGEVAPQVTERYTRAIQNKHLPLSIRDRKLLAFIMKHPSTVALVDAGLVLINPGSAVRQRLLVLFAILESTPDYHEYFLPRKQSYWYFFRLIFVGLKAGLKAVVGVLLIKVIVR